MPKVMKKINLSLISLFLITACAKDFDPNTYRNTLADKYRAQLSSVAGAYSGAVTSAQDGSAIGAMQITLAVDSGFQNSADGLTTETSAILNGSIHYAGLSSSDVAIDKGFYDPSTGAFVAQIPVTNESGTNYILKLNGSIIGGVLNGSIYVDHYPKFGGNFNLDLNGQTPAAVVDKKSARARILSGDTMVYSGHLNDTKQTIVALYLKRIAPNSGSHEAIDLLNVFSPVRVLRARLDLQFAEGNQQTFFAINTNDAAQSASDNYNLSGSGSFTAGSNIPSNSFDLRCVRNTNLDLQCKFNEFDITLKPQQTN